MKKLVFWVEFLFGLEVRKILISRDVEKMMMVGQAIITMIDLDLYNLIRMSASLNSPGSEQEL